MGGAAAVLERYEVGTVLTTYDSKESDEIDAYRAALKKSSAVAARVVQPTVLTIDGLTYEILTAKKTYYENDTSNDSSLVVKMTFEDVSWLFAGDVEEARIQELLDSGADLSATVLKVPHHGKSEDNTKEFIQAVMPFCAVITSSDDDPEDEKTVKQLEKIDCIVFLTLLGTVTMVSDGTELNISQ